jgi:transposase
MVSGPAITAPYTLLPTTPTKAEGASTAYLEKQEVLIRHAREGSLSAIPASFQQSQQSQQRWRRLVTLAALAVVSLGTVGVVVNHRSVRRLVRPEGELQYNSRHKIAYNFETAEVPSEWSCNPFQEPGRLFVDTENKVRRHFIFSLPVFSLPPTHRS